MGNSQVKSTEREKKNSVEDQIAQYLFGLWPGLEDQLVQSYLCHDVEGVDSVPYDVLEPVLRHHLMQCGLIEYVTRFANPEGTLNTKAVAPYLKECGINLSKPLSMENWKKLNLAWIALVQDTQAEDVSRWQQDLQLLQDKQTQEYKKSMELFQEEYLRSLEGYYKAIEAEHKHEQAQREEWEQSQKLQEDFYNDQMGYCQRANDEAVKAFQDVQSCQKTVAEAYFKQIKPHRKSSSIVTYSYTLPEDQIVGPISAGCRAPSLVKCGPKRNFKMSRRGSSTTASSK